MLICTYNSLFYARQSHHWQATLGNAYKEDGYTSSLADPSIHFCRADDTYTIHGTYGDDVFGGTSGEKAIVVDELCKCWESNEVLNETLLGVHISHDTWTGSITLSQT